MYLSRARCGRGGDRDRARCLLIGDRGRVRDGEGARDPAERKGARVRDCGCLSSSRCLAGGFLAAGFGLKTNVFLSGLFFGSALSASLAELTSSAAVFFAMHRESATAETEDGAFGPALAEDGPHCTFSSDVTQLLVTAYDSAFCSRPADQ